MSPLGVHSLRSLGAPKQGQLITGKVGIQKGKALKDTVHQALRGHGFWLHASGLWTSTRVRALHSPPSQDVVAPHTSPVMAQVSAGQV